MAQNPPGTGHGWHPYPTSLRIVNWIKWFLSGNTAPNDLLNSLASQARWLRNRVEYHLPGNHLLSNAKALVFVGIFFEGKAADGWRLKGVQLFDRGSGEQILGDGGHFELSPMYHLTVLEDVLDLINLHRTYKFPVPERWLLVAERMLHWASVMRHPDGEIPFFNDAALEIAPTPKAVMGYAQQLGFNWFPIREEREIKLLKDSGFAKLQNASCVAFIDVAPVGPDHLAGHAHADTLSIEVSIGAQRVFVNSGTSLYAPGDERHRQRSTAAHNTVEIDGENSSEVWADFRLARRARPKDIQTVPAAMSISAWHDGYCRLRGKPRHHRSLTLLDSVLRVHDRVSGTGVHECAGRFHLHPEISVSRLEQEEGRFRATISFKDKSQPGVELIIQGPVSVSVEETSFHPEFGLNIPNQCIVFRYKGSLPCEVITELRW